MIRSIIKHISLLSLCLLFIAIIPYIYISIYTHPIADDFTYSFTGQYSDLASNLVNEYINWNGRYTSNFLVLINPIVYHSLFLYKLVPVFIILLSIVCYAFFIYVLFEKQYSKTSIWILSILLFLCFAHQMPIVSEGIYWYTGAVTYQVGNCIALIYISSLLLFFQKKYFLGSKYSHLVFLTVLLCFAIGFNEVIMIALVFFSFVLLVICYNKGLRNRHSSLYLFIMTLFFSAIVYFAPGNEVRESNFSNIHNFVHSLMFSSAQTLRFFLEWMSSVPLLLLSVLYFFLNRQMSKKVNLFAVSFYLSPLPSIFLLLTIIFICTFPAYWSTAILGQHRTLNVAYFIFLIMWFVNLTVFYNYYKKRLDKLRNLNIKLYYFIFFVIWLSLLFSKNGYNVMTDIFYGRVQKYDKQMNERYALVESSNDTIYFKPIVNPPKSLFVLDIAEDPTHWVNKGYAIYFRLGERVVIKK